MFMPLIPRAPMPQVTDAPATDNNSSEIRPVKRPNKKPNTVLEYQITPYDYYVKDYFLAKSLLYVLSYKDDSILFHVALDEAAIKFKIHKADIIKHLETIELLNP